MIQSFYENLCMVERVVQLDAFGGEHTEYVPRVYLQGTITNATSQQEQLFGKPGEKAAYVIATDIGVNLKQGDIIRRESTGVLYRVTSDAEDMRIPAIACMQFEQVNAEVIRV